MNQVPSKKQALYHITRAETWSAGQAENSFREPSLEGEGFIHCSFAGQMIKTANRFYQGQRGLLILKIDPERLMPAVRLEPAEDGELFPHIYGPVNPDAVCAVLAFDPDMDGSFTSLPAGVD